MNEAVERFRRKSRQLREDPHTQERHARWLAENRRQNLEEPQKEKLPSQALIDSIHAWAAEHPELVPVTLEAKLPTLEEITKNHCVTPKARS